MKPLSPNKPYSCLRLFKAYCVSFQNYFYKRNAQENVLNTQIYLRYYM